MKEVSVFAYASNGYHKTLTWYKNNKLHRNIDKPAVYLFDDTRICSARWAINGISHRTSGPAWTWYITHSEWETFRYNCRINNIEFNPIIYRDEYGILGGFEYYKNGLLHREDGPAYCGKFNSLNQIKWYVNGNDITELVMKYFSEIGILYDMDSYDNMTYEEKTEFKLRFL